MCEFVSDAGFLNGIWDGLVVLFTLIVSAPFDVGVYNQCQDSWFYDLGFVLGAIITVLLLEHNSDGYFLLILIATILAFFAWIVTFVFGVGYSIVAFFFTGKGLFILIAIACYIVFVKKYKISVVKNHLTKT